MRQLKTTNYFSHDSNARNDEKIVRLRMKLGAAGYGVYFMILERLREQKNYTSAKDYNVIAFDLRVDAATVKSVIEDFGLFAFTDNGKCFYSESFSARMGVKDNLRQQRAAAGKAAMERRWYADTEEKKEERKAKAVKKASDNDNMLELFFRDDNRANLEALLMNFKMKPADMPKLRKLAEEAVSEWKLSEKRHADYTDFSQHLINTMRIKIQNSKGKQQEEGEQKPASYAFNGFGGKDV